MSNQGKQKIQKFKELSEENPQNQQSIEIETKRSTSIHELQPPSANKPSFEVFKNCSTKKYFCWLSIFATSLGILLTAILVVISNKNNPIQNVTQATQFDLQNTAQLNSKLAVNINQKVNLKDDWANPFAAPPKIQQNQASAQLMPWQSSPDQADQGSKYFIPTPENYTCSNYLLHIQTDKPVYKPSDVIFIQAYLIDPLSKKPCDDSFGLYATLEIYDGQDSIIYSQASQSLLQSGSFSFATKVPTDVKGGKYQIVISSGITQFNIARRKILINQYDQPDYFVTTDFDKVEGNYLPGSDVQAKVKVRKPDGSGLMSGSSVILSNDQYNMLITAPLTDQGEVLLKFQIPEDFSAELFVCTLIIKDGFSAPDYGTYSTSLSVSVLNPSNILVQFFSPNTQWITGVPLTVYFQAYSQDQTNPDAKIQPFEFENAELLYNSNFSSEFGQVVQELQSIKHIHNGRGKFIFIPEINKTYQLNIDLPNGMSLPTPLNYSLVIQSLNDGSTSVNETVFETSISISVAQTVISWEEQTQNISLDLYTPQSVSVFGSSNYSIKAIVFNKDQQVQNFEYAILQTDWTETMQNNFTFNQANIPITLNQSNFSQAGGVHILWVTVSNNETQVNSFEKLIYVRPSMQSIDQNELNVSLSSGYLSPGDPVNLNINLQNYVNETFYTSVIVTDVSSYLQTQKSQLPPSLPSMVFLEKEVSTLGGTVLSESPLDEFLNSQDYVDPWFSIMTSQISTDYQNTQTTELNIRKQKAQDNIDALLAVQDWRKGVFTNQEKYQEIIGNMYGQSERMKNLVAKKQNFFYPGPIYENWDDGFAPQCDDDICQPAAMADFAFAPMAEFMPAPMAVPMAGPMMPQPRIGPQMRKKEVESNSKSASETDQDPSQTISNTDIDLQDFMTGVDCLARNFSHPLRFGFSKAQPRVDFTQTLYYQASTEQVGNINFALNDQVTTFLVQITLVSSQGRYAVLNHYFNSQMLVYSTFSLPRAMLFTDVSSVPILIYNNLPRNITVDYQIADRVFINPKQSRDQTMAWMQSQQQTVSPDQPQADYTSNIILTNLQNSRVQVQANSYAQIWYSFDSNKIKRDQKSDATQFFMQVSLKVQNISSQVQDSSIKSTKVYFGGVPQTLSQNGILQVKNSSLSLNQDTSRQAIWRVNIPQGVSMIPQFRIQIFSSDLDQLIEMLRKLLMQPNGCFEQTSSTTYPQVMALSFLQELEESGGLSPEKLKALQELREKFLAYLEEGYKRLLNFETSSKGYEWFGMAPGHEALTAYGLMQFNDMMQVQAIEFIDYSAYTRNINWLLSRKNPKIAGQFLLNPQALDSFGRAGQQVTDAYIVWALTQSYLSLSDSLYSDLNSSNQTSWSQEETYQNLKEQLDYLKTVATQSKDPYILALVSSSLSKLNHTTEASIFTNILQKNQNKTTGAIDGAKTSITNSFGEDLKIETTSLAVIAWIQTDKIGYLQNINSAVNYLTKINKQGLYGSTQATILSLKALSLYTKFFSDFRGKGNFSLLLNNQTIQSIPFDASKPNQSFSSIDFSKAINNKIEQIYLQNMNNSNEFQTLTSKPFEFLMRIDNYTLKGIQKGGVSPLQVQYQMSTYFKNYQPIQPIIPSTLQNHSLQFQVTKSPQSILLLNQSLGTQQTVSITIVNDGKQNEGMVIVVLPLPSCLKLSGGAGGLAQLENLKMQGLFNHYEMGAFELTLYWTSLKMNQRKKISLNFQRAFGNDFIGNNQTNCKEYVSRAYYYYNSQIIKYQ